MDAVQLVRIGESANAHRTKHSLVPVAAPRLCMEVEEKAVELAHEMTTPKVVPMRTAA